MKIFISIIIATALFISCVQTQGGNTKIAVGSSDTATANEAVAYFSEGCFWHAEIVFQSLLGVRDAVSGYAGGHTTDPTYEKVASGETGHAETVQVYYDPTKISYTALVRAFFASQDPWTLNRQGNDAGTEYRSIAFYRTEAEKKIIEAEIKNVNDSKKYRSKVVTEVLAFTKFYKGEDYHQEYISNNPGNSYVQNVSIPDFKRFKAAFKEGVFK